jgi:hypothetical protein
MLGNGRMADLLFPVSNAYVRFVDTGFWL